MGSSAVQVEDFTLLPRIAPCKTNCSKRIRGLGEKNPFHEDTLKGLRPRSLDFLVDSTSAEGQRQRTVMCKEKIQNEN